MEKQPFLAETIEIICPKHEPELKPVRPQSIVVFLTCDLCSSQTNAASIREILKENQLKRKT